MEETTLHSLYIPDLGTVVYEQFRDRGIGEDYPGELSQIVRGLTEDEIDLNNLQELEPGQEERVQSLLESQGGYGPVEFDYQDLELEEA
jgi:hypothetical protein